MSVVNSIRTQLTPIHPQGYPFIGGFALASLILFWLWSPLGWLGTLATLWCAYFFRDPPRVTPTASWWRRPTAASARSPMPCRRESSSSARGRCRAFPSS